MNKIKNNLKFFASFAIIWTAMTLESIGYQIQKELRKGHLG